MYILLIMLDNIKVVNKAYRLKKYTFLYRILSVLLDALHVVVLVTSFLVIRRIDFVCISNNKS